MITIDNIIVNPKRRQGYISFNCPQCEKKDRAFKYDNSPIAKCNRASCGWTMNLAAYQKEDKSFKEFKKTLDTYQDYQEEDTSTDRTNRAKCALGYSASNVDSYLQMRILRHIPGVTMQDLLDQKIFGLSSMVRESSARKWDRQNYRLFTPLYSMDSRKILSGQHRYTGLGAPPLKRDGTSFPKNVSMRGNYGRYGVTFGSLRKALLKADLMEMPTIYLVEGDTDYITARAMGLETTVGVPGAAQAKKVIKYLNSIDWHGKVVLVLDQDEAGRKATEEAINFATIHCEERMLVADSSPGKEGYDLNDSLKDFGYGFTLKMVLNERRRANLSDQQVKIFETEHYQRISRAGLFVQKNPIKKIHKERLENTIKITGDKKSPIKKFRRVSHCGTLMQTEVSYCGDQVEVGPTVKKRCSSRWCDHCRVIQWNYSISKQLMDTWPERLCVGEHEFEGVEGLKRLKKSILSALNIPAEASQGQTFDNIHVHANILTSKLVIVADPRDISAVGMQSLCPISTSRDLALRDYLKPAYLSPIDYLKEKVEDPDWNLQQDEFLSSKTKLFHSRAGLPWPTREQISDDVSGFFEELNKKEEEDAGEGVGKEEKLSFLVSFARRSSGKMSIMSVSQRSFSFDGLSQALMFDSDIATNPTDPTINYLQEPSLCPKNVEDIIRDFIEIGQRIPLEKADYELHSPWSNKEVEEVETNIRYMNNEQREAHWLEMNAEWYGPIK